MSGTVQNEPRRYSERLIFIIFLRGQEVGRNGTTHSVSIVRPQMKCQRHDELTILSNNCSDAGEQAYGIVPIHSLVLYASNVSYCVSLTRDVFVHINYHQRRKYSGYKQYLRTPVFSNEMFLHQVLHFIFIPSRKFS